MNAITLFYSSMNKIKSELSEIDNYLVKNSHRKYVFSKRRNLAILIK